MSKHTLLHWKYMHDRARSLCMITNIFPLSQYSLLFILFTFHTLRSPYHRVEQAKCIMGIMPTPEVAFRSQGLGTSSWGSSEPGTHTRECIVCRLIGWKLYRDWPWVTCEDITFPQKLHHCSVVGCEDSVKEEYATNWESEARHRDSDFTVTKKYFQMWTCVVCSAWNRMGPCGCAFPVASRVCCLSFLFSSSWLAFFFKNNHQGSLEASWTKM